MKTGAVQPAKIDTLKTDTLNLVRIIPEFLNDTSFRIFQVFV